MGKDRNKLCQCKAKQGVHLDNKAVYNGRVDCAIQRIMETFKTKACGDITAGRAPKAPGEVEVVFVFVLGVKCLFVLLFVDCIVAFELLQ